MARNEFACDCNVIHQDLVESTQKQMVDEDILNKMADFFSILGDTTRVKILDALDKNELCVCDIANIVGTTQSAISHQLRILKQAKLVKFRKEGKVVFYSLDDDHIHEIVKKGCEHIEEL